MKGLIKKGYFLSIVFFSTVILLGVSLGAHPAEAGSCSATATGNWSTLTWSAGCTGVGGIPGTGDSVSTSTYTVTLDTNTPALTLLTLGDGGVSGGLNTSGSNYSITAGSINFNGGTLTANASTITLTGTSGTLFDGAPYTYFVAGTSTVVVTSSSGTPLLLLSSATFYNLTINASGATVTSTSGNGVTINHDLTITAGTFSVTGSMTVTGSTSVSGTISFPTQTNPLFTGAVTVNSGGTWTCSSNESPQFEGGLTVNSSSTFTSGTGPYLFMTNAQSIGGTQSFTITSLTNNVTSGNGLTFSGATPTITTLTQGTNAVLTFSGGVPTITTLSASSSTNTVQYTNTSAGQTVIATTYSSLTINNAGQTATLGGTTTVNGTLTVSASATLELSTASLSIGTSGGISISGTFSDNSSTGTNSFLGSSGVTINSGGTWTTSGNASFTIRGGLTVNSSSTFTSGSGTYTFNGSSQTIGGTQAYTITNLTNSVVSGTGLTFSGANPTVTTLTQSASARLTFSGSVPTITTLTATATGNTVNYTNTSAGQTIIDTSYKNLTINNTGQTATFANTATITGNLTITAGTLDMSASNYAMNLGGNFSNSGTFTARSGTVTLNGSAQQTISGTHTGTSSFYNLTITNATGADASDGERTGFTPSVIFSTAMTATNNYTITTASVRVQYLSGATYTFANINWNGGATGTKIYFRNSATSGTWLLVVSGTQTAVTYVNVSRSDASGGSAISVTNATSTNGGNNTNWSFVSNVSPDTPSSLGPTAKVNGSTSNTTQPTLTFTLSDSDGSDTVKFEILISTYSDYSSPVVDYTSALAAQGSASFTVGQSAGSGTYTTGSSGQALASGSYYWEVKAIDNSAATSSYATANSGAIAFVVDATAPILSETTAVATPARNTIPSYTFTASEAGTITYGGDCSSTTSSAIAGVNTVVFSLLTLGIHSNCSILVTDTAGNASNTLAVTTFTIINSSGGGILSTQSTSHARGCLTGESFDRTTGVRCTNTGPSLSKAFLFTKNLKPGQKNTDIKELQKYLNAHGFAVALTGPGSLGNETEFFGPATRKALIKFQEKYAKEILVPIGLSKGTGSFATMTRVFVNAHQ